MLVVRYTLEMLESSQGVFFNKVRYWELFSLFCVDLIVTGADISMRMKNVVKIAVLMWLVFAVAGMRPVCDFLSAIPVISTDCCSVPEDRGAVNENSLSGSHHEKGNDHGSSRR